MKNGKSGVRPIPDGMHSITAHLVVKGGAAAIDFYKKVFGAVEVMRFLCPTTGKLMHGEVKIGDSVVFLGDEFPEMGCNSPLALGNSPVTIHLYVEDADAVFNQAVAAGAQVRMPLMDMFWGDRYGQVTDPFGHIWSIATHIEDVPPEELATRAQAAFAQQNQSCAGEPAKV
jgi:uncharacterized glyoxalase superfamily protein PhnB